MKNFLFVFLFIFASKLSASDSLTIALPPLSVLARMPDKQAKLFFDIKKQFVKENDWWFVGSIFGCGASGYFSGKAEHIRLHQQDYRPGTWYYMEQGGAYETFWNDGYHFYRNMGLYGLGGSSIALGLSVKGDIWWKIPIKFFLCSAFYYGGTRLGY